MVNRRPRIIAVTCAVLMTVLCIAGCIALKPSLKGFLTNGDNPPVSSFDLTIDVNRRDELFTQLRKYADKHRLQFSLTFYDPEKRHFLVHMYGTGFSFAASEYVSEPRVIAFSLFSEGTTPMPQQRIDELMIDLKAFMREIPGVEISEEK